MRVCLLEYCVNVDAVGSLDSFKVSKPRDEAASRPSQLEGMDTYLPCL